MPTPILNAPTPGQRKLELLRQHFPQAVETDAQGRIRINAGALQLAIDPANPAGIQVEEDGYELRWVGKREAYHSAFLPVQKIIAPLPDDSKHWDTTGNLLLRGDNLDALRLLRHSYFGKVKLIYIDPPYNTQSDAFIYRDDFSAKQSEVLAQLGYTADNIDYIKNIYGARTHSGWLSFMYPRLLLAKDLLRDDGVIFISIDDNEQAQLKLLCDEVFGQENHLGDFVWRRRASSALAERRVSSDHEHVLAYHRGEFSSLGMPKDYKNFSNPDGDPRGEWVSGDLTVGMGADERPNQFYDLVDPETGKRYAPNRNRVWSYIPESMDKLIAEGRVLFPSDINRRPMLKRFKQDLRSDANPMSTWLADVGLNTEATKDIQNLFESNIFDYSKPLSLLNHLIQTSTSGEDVILDFFAGSGTTGEAVMRLNAKDGGKRQFILVQIPQPIDPKKQKEAHRFVTETLGKPEATIFEITAERLRRAGAKIEAEQAKKAKTAALQPAQLEGFSPEAEAGSAPAATVDTGFRVFDLVDDPDALILQKPLQHASQADVLALQAAIATPQPALLPRILYNLLLAENLPLTTPLRTVIDQQVYLAANVAFVVRALPLDLLTDTLRALQQEAAPPAYLTVYAPWIADDNFMLGIKTVAETLGYSEDKLRLRG
ncbi:site-specific DNA-methyltransferase [Polaromonas sp.]|uniref:site-specific DNA-methyltransferase n=1 Tax=Polaromonas sp. TaxID=1869339 RepID=UPI003BB6422B